MLSKASAVPEGGISSPGRFPDDVVKLTALVAPVAAGLLMFRVPAGEALAIAVGAGVLAHLGVRVVASQYAGAPIVSAIIAVGLVGAGASLTFVAVGAAAAALLEIVRARLLPSARVQVGVLVYTILFLATRGAVASYTNPFGGRAQSEPIHLWHTYYPAWASAVDPVRLYVGNLPGPIFATSLVAVVIGIAYMWYARRLSPIVLFGFFLGALTPILALGWNPSFQLDSGPAWLIAGLVLADREALPTGRLSRPLLGYTAGLAGFAARSRGFGIEAVFVSAAAVQLTVGLVQAGVWIAQNRHDLVSAFRSRDRGPRFGAGVDEPSPV